jgi:hypothetical protein
MPAPLEKTEVDEDTKLLGGQVPVNIYWQFKEIAAKRNESMSKAILHAALMYIDLQKEIDEGGENNGDTK